MLKFASRFGLLSALLIGLSPLPARSDSSPAQGGSQGVVINGNNNQVTQVINQTIINRPNNSRPNGWNKEDKDKKYKHKHKHKNHRRPHGEGGPG